MTEDIGDITILDENLEITLIIDEYFSLIWVERYEKLGDFVLELPYKYVGHPKLKAGYIITVPWSKRVMIIGDLNPVSDPESGSKLVLTGYSGESILQYRVTNYGLDILSNIEDVIEVLINEHFITPVDAKRTIDNLIFSRNTDWRLGEMWVSNQFKPSTIYSIVRSLCDSHQASFKVELTESRELECTVYTGINRSYIQDADGSGDPPIPYVVFSDENENILTSAYYQSTNDYKNVTYIVNEEDDPMYEDLSVYDYSLAEETGMGRRESVVEIAEINRASDPEELLSDYDVLAILYQKGLEDLYEHRKTFVFDGELDINGRFKYGVDFFMGDIVQCNLEGEETRARLVETIRSISPSGDVFYGALDFSGGYITYTAS